MSEYIYRPLEEGHIRIFILSLGRFDEPLVGRLVSHSLHAGVPSYTALSYAWGAETSPSLLQLLPSSSRTITSNLECALRYLRKEERETFLWVDSLCINQGNNLEKAQQVRGMRNVYATATEVVAFLGDGDEHSVAGLQLAAAIADSAAPNPELPERLRLSRAGQQQQLAYRGLYDVLRRPWFSRLWVVQEALVARKFSFQCGSASISPSMLCDALDSCKRLFANLFTFSGLSEPTEISLFDSLELVRDIAARKLVGVGTKRKFDLMDTLWKYRGYKSEKARDHLFALLGLANVPYSPLLSPDYESTLETVVKRYARYFVHYNQHPMRLLYCAGGISATGRFPSWIPNWTTDQEDQDDHSTTNLSSESTGQPYSTGFMLPLRMRMGKTDDTLIVSGKVFNCLSMVGESHWIESVHEDSGPSWFDMHLGFIDECDSFLSRLPKYPTGESPEILLRKLLACNRIWKPNSDLGMDHGAQYRRFRSLLEDLRTTPAMPPSSGRYDHAVLQMNGMMWYHIKNRRLCLTKNGYIGMVPLSAEVGDVICVVYGSQVPFVFRPCKDIKGAYRLVGKCYIQGIMDGESKHIKDLEEKEFKLV
jgi:Heterokaryon incompatibility protein (HET)